MKHQRKKQKNNNIGIKDGLRMMTVMQFNNGASLIETPNRKGIDLIDGFMKYVRSMSGQQNKQ